MHRYAKTDPALMGPVDEESGLLRIIGTTEACYLAVTGLVLINADIKIEFRNDGPNTDYFCSPGVASRRAGVVHGRRDYARLRMPFGMRPGMRDAMRP